MRLRDQGSESIRREINELKSTSIFVRDVDVTSIEARTECRLQIEKICENVECLASIPRVALSLLSLVSSTLYRRQASAGWFHTVIVPDERHGDRAWLVSDTITVTFVRDITVWIHPAEACPRSMAEKPGRAMTRPHKAGWRSIPHSRKV